MIAKFTHLCFFGARPRTPEVVGACLTAGVVNGEAPFPGKLLSMEAEVTTTATLLT